MINNFVCYDMHIYFLFFYLKKELLRDLQLAKMQTWDEKQRISEMFLEERKHHLSSKVGTKKTFQCVSLLFRILTKNSSIKYHTKE